MRLVMVAAPAEAAERARFPDDAVLADAPGPGRD